MSRPAPAPRKALRILAVAALAAAVLAAPAPARAWTFELGSDMRLGLTAFVQAQARFAEDEAPGGKAWSKDFYLHRVRLILSGDLTKHISFVVHTEQAGWGRGGNWSFGLYLSDAFMTFRVVDEFQVDVGRMLTPPSRQHFGSSVRLNALDFHGGVLRYVDGSQQNGRDIGVQVRGNVLGGRLGYRAGVFNGSQGRPLQKDAKDAPVKDPDGKGVLDGNPSDWPRFLGYVRWNFLGVEPAFNSAGIHFAKTPIVSLGAGFDAQPGVAMDRPAVLGDDGRVKTKGSVKRAWAVAADLYADVPFGAAADHELVVLASVLWYDHGNELAWAADGTSRTAPARTSGLGVMAEAGWRWRWIEPVVAADWFDGRRDGQDLLALRGGLNFWIRQHGANVKAEYQAQKKGDLSKAPWRSAVTMQAQLFF